LFFSSFICSHLLIFKMGSFSALKTRFCLSFSSLSSCPLALLLLVLLVGLSLLSSPVVSSSLFRRSTAAASTPSATLSLLSSSSLSLPLSLSSSFAPNYTLCSACETLSEQLGPLVGKLPQSWLVSLTYAGCLAYEATGSSPDCKGFSQCEELCRGISDEYVPLLIPLLTNGTLSSQQVCAGVQLCPAPLAPPRPGYYVPVPSNLSDDRGQRQWVSWSLTSGTGTILHLTDVHFDTLYAAGSKTDCGEPLCCRAEWGPGGASNSAGQFGDYNCDSPAILIDTLFSFLNKSLSPRPDAILYTGDDPAHDIWNQNRNVSLNAIEFVRRSFAYWFADVPVFFSLGNHEAIPVNEFGGPEIDQWLYQPLSTMWSDYLSVDALHTLGYGGYYQALLRPGVRVIALHTTMFSPDNAYLLDDVLDYGHQLDWLNDTLRQCEQRREEAIIIGHASPADWFADFNAVFNQLLLRYRATVLNGSECHGCKRAHSRHLHRRQYHTLH